MCSNTQAVWLVLGSMQAAAVFGCTRGKCSLMWAISVNCIAVCAHIANEEHHLRAWNAAEA